MSTAVAALLLLLLRQAAPEAVASAAWPEADRLFREDPRWLGGDAAFSVPLGGERVLWLFGDSFVGDGTSRERGRATFVRNSAGLQTGLDPEHARMEFLWRERDGHPSAFFPADGDLWRWPSHGLRVDDALILFTWRMESAGEGSFGFRAVGWDAFRVAEPDTPPSEWTLQLVEGFETSFPVIMGVALLDDGEHVLAYAVAEPGNHDAYLLRWSRADFRAGRLTRPEWYDADRWVAHGALAPPPRPVIERAHTEFSVQRAPGGGFLQVQTEGFLHGTVVLRTAASPAGPWSPPRELLRPPESELPGVLVYAGKAHPELVGAPLVVTYASNAEEARLLADHDLYYPRFLRLDWRERPEGGR